MSRFAADAVAAAPEFVLMFAAIAGAFGAARFKHKGTGVVSSRERSYANLYEPGVDRCYVSTLADRIYAFLNEEGHVVETDGAIRNTTRIHFRSRGLHFAVYVTRDDDRFLQVTCSMPIEAGVAFDSGLLRALWTCQQHFRDVKYALTGDTKRFVCSTEIVLPATSADEAVFWRAIGVVEAGLYAAMREIRARHMVKAAAQKFIEECLQPR